MRANPFSAIGVPGRRGRLLLCACPGRWPRDRALCECEAAAQDLACLAEAGANGLLSLVEAHELPGGATAYAEAVARAGMRWVHLPIADFGVPAAAFERGWRELALLDRLGAGETWVVHCRAGLGRTGLVASRILVEAGSGAAEAIARIRREHAAEAVETAEQHDYLAGFAAALAARDEMPDAGTILEGRP